MDNSVKNFSTYQIKKKFDLLLKKQAQLKKLEMQWKKTKEDIRSIENDLANAFPQYVDKVVD